MNDIKEDEKLYQNEKQDHDKDDSGLDNELTAKSIISKKKEESANNIRSADRS